MPIIELVLALLAVTAGLEVLARTFRLPLPALLVAAGVTLALIPGVPRPVLDPEAVFVVFIPPLLYWTALTSSYRDFRRYLTSITFLGVGLVLATTVAVAAVAHALIPELNWPAAFVLGAIISPPDPVAAIAVTRHLPVPKPILTVLEGEGLVNDATALVAFQMAIRAADGGETFSLGEATLRLFFVGLGGVGVGLVIGFLIATLRRRIKRAPIVEATISLLTPFFAYLPAERLGTSGVLAVVAVGLYLGRRGPRIVSAQSRLQSMYMWRMIAFLLEGLIFLLVGLRLPEAFSNLGNHTFLELLVYAVLVSATAIVVRLLWMYPGALASRLVRLPFGKWDPMPPWRYMVLVGFAGIRGGDSLVIALSVPLAISGGAPFPGRPMIIFLTFVVIVVTLVVLGLLLAPLVRKLGLKPEGQEGHEEAEARRKLFAAARALLMESRPGAQAFVRDALMVVKVQREELIRLRDGDMIGDDVMIKLQHELDLEEVLLESRPTAPPPLH